MPGSRGPASLRVIAGDDEEGSRLQLFRREVRRRTQKYDAINLTRHGFDRRIAGGPAAETAANHRDRFDAMRFQVTNRGEHIVLKWSVIEISLARTGRAAESAEVDCQNSESRGHQSSGLIPPTLLVKSAAVSEHNGAVAFAIEVGANSSTISSGE